MSKYKKSNDKALASMVNDEFTRREAERRPFELQWRLNLAFIEGNQFVDINATAQSLMEIPKALWWTEREVFNQIAAVTEVRMARLSRLHPVLKTRPGTGEQADLKAAKIGTHLLRNAYNDKIIQNKIQEAVSWTETCGTVFFKNTWNADLGPVVARFSGQGGPTQDLREGDLEVMVVPPQEIYPDNTLHQNLADCESLIHARGFPVGKIEDRWNVKVAPEAVSVMKLSRAMHGLSGGQRFNTDSRSALKDYALVKEYWERPSKKFPKGRLIIVAGGEVLHAGDLPFLIGENAQPDLPFTKYDSIERTGVFWGRSIVERLIPVQRRYNAVRNRKAEYLNRAAIGILVVEEDSTDMDMLEQEAGAPGTILTYKRGSSPPAFMPTSPLPAAFAHEEASLLQEFSQLSGVSELSRQSAAPAGVKSGVALSIALEQDDTRLASTAANLSQFMVDSGKQWLRLYKQYAHGSRILRLVGKNNVVEVLEWSGTDIQSDDVVVEPYSALAESPAQRRQMVHELLAAGLFADPDTGKITKEMRSRIFEMIDMGNWESGDDDDALHLTKAERENLRMADGHKAVAVDYDDHILHISRHNKFRLTVDYEASAHQLDAQFSEHVQEHVQFMAPAEPEAAMQAMLDATEQQAGENLPPQAAEGG